MARARIVLQGSAPQQDNQEGQAQPILEDDNNKVDREEASAPRETD